VARVLVLFAHPSFSKSRVHQRLVDAVPDHPDLTFRDLYEEYPDFHVNVPAEQALLSSHDVIVFQHPIYWYSVPPLLKQWIDLVLEHGWAYGREGRALEGKRVLSAVSTGGPESSYQREGFHGRTLSEFLAPIERTVTLCRMEYLEPFVVYGTHRLSEEDVGHEAERYRSRLLALLENGAGA
jgi:glutathione-regulated potassium-efflux system ancillary protein KefG